MYHKISAHGIADPLTVPVNHLEAQLHYLKQEGYNTIQLSDLVKYIRQGTPLPEKPVLITFDDGYRDNFTAGYPVFERYGLKANIFLVPTFLKERAADASDYLSLEDMQAMDPRLVEYGMHSYDHKSYKTLSPSEVETDLRQCKEMLTRMGVAFQPCLAFPYGAYPKKNADGHREFLEILAAGGIVAAFRIGNRLNTLPLRNPLLIQRLDIQGNNNFKKFTQLLRSGKTLFGYL
ncbi:MAG: polysaccharide deacetylase family protein [Niastella sp.]|nr:polysaccharide deacetylase family protein [Niastella sp.]